MRIVYGDCRGMDLPEEGGRVFFYGDCTQFDGKIGDRHVKVESRYVKRTERAPEKARSTSLPVKIVASYLNALMSLREPHIVIRGCPVSVAEHVLMLAIFGGVKNAYFDERVTFAFTYHWIASSLVRLLKGQPPQ